MLLLTGPNYSGKSVYMKQVSGSLDRSLGLSLNRCVQVALIVYLAQIGRYAKVEFSPCQ
jgi:ABC-type hemin transport system ATPase subunit